MGSTWHLLQYPPLVRAESSLPADGAAALPAGTSTRRSGVACDGRFLYIHVAGSGLAKVGTGRQGTLRGHVYARAPAYRPADSRRSLVVLGDDYLVYTSPELAVVGAGAGAAELPAAADPSAAAAAASAASTSASASSASTSMPVERRPQIAVLSRATLVELCVLPLPLVGDPDYHSLLR